MKNKITKDKLDKYRLVTSSALEMAKNNPGKRKEFFEDFIDMVERYVSDSKYFEEKKDYINSFAALNYAHGWLDAGARSKVFHVHDSKLFTVD